MQNRLRNGKSGGFRHPSSAIARKIKARFGFALNSKFLIKFREFDLDRLEFTRSINYRAIAIWTARAVHKSDKISIVDNRRRNIERFSMLLASETPCLGDRSNLEPAKSVVFIIAP
jgi:hypothetical protein